jgi:hypothetical protein
MGQWDPPWLRKRRARGPPAAPSGSSSAGGDRLDFLDLQDADLLPTDEDYCLDPPAPDDPA